MSAPITTASETDRTASPDSAGRLVLVLTLLEVALLALAGRLWLSMGLGLKVCAVCFYQWTFILAVVAVSAGRPFINHESGRQVGRTICLQSRTI